MYYVVVLKRCKSPAEHLRKVYLQRVRPVLEYACQAWHPGLTIKLTLVLEGVQKRALGIIYSDLDYESAFKEAKLESLKDRRKRLCFKYFHQIQHPDHKLHCLLPEAKVNLHDLRECIKYEPPRLRTLRARGSFINWALYNLQ
jgi:hypothetical protein